ncbi:FHA domain-containing protein [Nocardia brevicatena]|uniref:FHA domain-containing protein n=1 Tax=Nocardia brevicatena TaxID=37327 RepID=UPI00030D767E|nr:FHA domain-containing protein [Nocardia brevicatena]
MRDRQVEVVAGSHVLARVAGVVVLVAHRESGRPNPESTAVAALEALVGVVREVLAQGPGNPGELIVRAVTRWLMRDAERISPGRPIDFGILAAAGPGRLTVFLHGAVTAVCTGERVERYRGREALFTVDRSVDTPAHAAALFVDDAAGGVPELPAERGIGWLVEGIAQGGGVIVWSDTALYRRGSAMVAATAEDEAGAEPASTVPGDREQPLRPAPVEQGNSAPVQPMRAADTPIAPTAIPTLEPHEATDDVPDLHRAATEQANSLPSPRPAPNTPAVDPELRRRTEATAKGTALTAKVLGFKCARAHPSDPRSAFCTVCGIPVDQTQPLIEVVRPPLGMLVFDDGTSYPIVGDTVLGRDPEHSEQARRGLVPLRVPDTSGGMSRAHAELLLVNWDVTLVDRGSTNGTHTRLPGYPAWVRLLPNRPMVLVPGTEVSIGNRVLRFEPAAPPPFG